MFVRERVHLIGEELIVVSARASRVYCVCVCVCVLPEMEEKMQK